ncbi:MAG: insulinase family protein [Acidiferrobacterales bacterium]|nr:insulinase family protein [Acidiferrobacterales bacterium]
MKKITFLLLWSVCALISSTALSQNSATTDNELAIPYQKYVLDNGLTLIVHEDKKAPVVAVNVWYHVGSKDEKVGRTGFAHLFEHLMFNGSENYDYDWFKAFDNVGGTGINGTTNQDRTNYFQVVPKNALEMTLWLESDRMGHLLGAIDQAKLDEQRSVVQNEKRQGENQPYGKVFSTILESVYPVGHPYSWSVIGSMEDLNAASIEDVHEWFNQKYGAANATLVISGDVEAESVKGLVEKYFGHIRPGPPQVKQTNWIAKRTGKHTQTMIDRVPQARVYKIWNIPEWGSPEADYLKLASSVLSSDKKSRLYNRLVYEERVASDVSAFSFNSEIGGLFGIIASPLDVNDMDYIEQAIDEELQLFIDKGPTREELSRVKTGFRAGFIRGMEKIGGFGGKSDLLAKNQVFRGDPNYYLNNLERIENASAKQITQTTKDWLSDGEYVLRVLPYEKYSVTDSEIDRSQGLPDVGAAPSVSFDQLHKTTLSNGLDVILAERSAIPVVRMSMLLNAGFSTDQKDKAGVANLTMQMLEEGTESMDGLEISTKLAQLGTYLSTRAGLDTSSVSLNTLYENLDESLEIFSDVILEPTFPESQLERLKTEQLNGIAQEKSSPFGVGFRLLPSLLYGEDHAYSAPFSGAGYEDSVASISVDDLRDYHQRWFNTSNATLIVVGDITLAEVEEKLESALAKMPDNQVPEKNIAQVAPLSESVIYLVDRPDSAQSAIIAANMMPEYGTADELPLELLNQTLGGSFSSRINMNLREDKGWAYGARTAIQNTQAQRPFLVQASVQTDKTAESLLEVHKELTMIIDSAPVSDTELKTALDKTILTLPGRWESAGAVQSDIASMVRYDLSDDYWDEYVKDLNNIELTQVHQAAEKYITPDKMLWLVVGDRAEIEQAVRDTNLGKMIVLDNEGNQVSE